MFKEFKEFALRGNAFDLAVGVIIGVAFGKIVSSLVSDILQPILGLIIGRVDFPNRFVTVSGEHFSTLAEAKAAGAVTLNYGLFINAIIDFIFVSGVIFLTIKQMNRLRRQKPEPQATTKACPYCLSVVPLRATKCPQCTSAL